mmetsp:Transcript_43222/g.135819  ORF Transcript_43222/g.135819 Transcript_43222/m.135819 type:complete len:354 (+) Transcript_43222:296-1357(+)
MEGLAAIPTVDSGGGASLQQQPHRLPRARPSSEVECRSAGWVQRVVKADVGDPGGKGDLHAAPVAVGAGYHERHRALVEYRSAGTVVHGAVLDPRVRHHPRNDRRVRQQERQEVHVAHACRHYGWRLLVVLGEADVDCLDDPNAGAGEDELHRLLEGLRQAQVVDHGHARASAFHLRQAASARQRMSLVRPDAIAEVLRVSVPRQRVRAAIQQGGAELGAATARGREGQRHALAGGVVHGEVLQILRIRSQPADDTLHETDVVDTAGLAELRQRSVHLLSLALLLQPPPQLLLHRRRVLGRRLLLLWRGRPHQSYHAGRSFPHGPAQLARGPARRPAGGEDRASPGRGRLLAG